MALTPEQKVAAATLRAKNAVQKVTPLGGTPVNMSGVAPSPAAKIAGYPTGGTPVNLANPAPLPSPQPAIAEGRAFVNLANTAPKVSPPLEVAPINPVPNTLPAVIPGNKTTVSPDLRIRATPAAPTQAPGEITRPFAVDTPGVVQGGSVAPGRNLTVSTTPVAPSPTPAPPTNQWSQTLADKSIASRFQASNQAEVLRAWGDKATATTVEPYTSANYAAGKAQLANRFNTTAGKAVVALDMARGAIDTGARIKDKTAAGKGLLDATVATVSENLHKRARDPFGMGSYQDQIALAQAEKQALGSDRAVELRAAQDAALKAGPALANPFSGGEVKPSAAALAHTPVGKPGDVEAPAAPATPTTSTQATRNPVGANFVTGAAPDPKQEAPTGEVFIERGASPGQWMLDRSGATQSFRATVDGVKGQATGRTSAGAQRGGYVGAATDAEAARALQDRAAQSAAAQQMIGLMNAGAEAERDLRATKLGISRGTLDAMEGRGGTWASEGPLLSVGKEGVNFGDEASRNSQIDGLLSRAASQTGRGASKRAQAMLGAAQALQAPGMERAKNDAELGKQSMAAQAAINAAQIKAQGDQASAQMREAGDNYRAKVNYASSTDSARIAQGGQDARLQYSEGKEDSRAATKALSDDFSAAAKQWEAVTSSPGKGQYAEVDKADAINFLSGLDPKKLSEVFAVEPATIERWKTQKFRTHEVPMIAGMVKKWKAGLDPWGPDWLRAVPPGPMAVMGVKD